MHSLPCDATDNINSVTITGTTLSNLNSGCGSASVNGYTAFPATGSTTASLQQGNVYTFNVETTDDSNISLWIDYNQNNLFDASEWTQISANNPGGTTASVSFIMPFSALPGTTRMRVRSRLSGNANGAANACTSFGSGETEDYTITITAAPACTGTPVAGTVTATPATVCAGVTSQLSATGVTIANGMVYQWEESDDNGVADPWANVTGGVANLYTYTSPALSADRWYRLKVTCTASSQTATSAATKVTFNNVVVSTFPYTQDFNTVTSNNLPCGITLNDANTDGYTWNTYLAQAGSTDRVMAYFYNDADPTIGANDWFFTPALNLQANKDYIVTFDYAALLSAFPEALEVRWGNAPTVAGMPAANTVLNLPSITNSTLASGTAAAIRPTTTGTYYIGFYAKSAADRYVLLMDNLVITELSPCSAAPSAGTVAASQATICIGETVELTATGASSAGGLVYQWEESDDNGVNDPWANVTGGTAAGVKFTTPSLSADRWYRLKVTCTAITQTATSAAVKVTVNSGAITSFPYTQDFDLVTAPAVPCGFIIEDSNNDNFTWMNDAYNTTGQQGMIYVYNDDDTTIPGNDWFFTPAIAMNASKEYIVTFNYAAAAFQGTTYPEKLEVRWGNAATSAAMTGGTIFSNLNINNTTMTPGTTSVIRPATTGNYHVGFHVISDPNQFFLTVDDINITERNISGLANELGNSVLVYPNPATDKVNVEISNTAAKSISVEVVNTLGQQVYKTSALNNQKNQLDLSKLSNGIYFVKVRLDDKVGTYRISVQK
ncbi:T9SS-dependent choice-of-anchor J family protein [Adhaeribacter soli]|uniref:T9SS-dependent choice-of-anchor J family protein n=1 Tax=Adhaeribacter soli TaxID=2607655 RepID=UPI00178676F0|nr:choice-of-anchor J domain-containing protein [Adhaeribacter soli]